MKQVLIFIIITSFLCQFSFSKQVCTRVPEKICNQVRREPYTKNVVEKVPVQKIYNVVEKRQVQYKEKVAKTIKVKVPCKVPYVSVKKVKVPVYKTEKVAYDVVVPYIVKEQRKKKVYYTQNYIVQVPKKFKVKYTETKYKKEKRTKKSVCLKKVIENYTKKVSKPYQTKCPKEVEKLVLKDKKVLESKIFKKKYWLGTYTNAGNDCYKKNYGWKEYSKKVPVTKKVAVKVKVIEKVPCIKTKIVDEKCTREVVKKEVCDKEYTVNVPYKVEKIKVVERNVPEKRTRKLFKWVNYEVAVKKTRTEKRFKNVVKKYEQEKEIKEVKYKDSFRYENKVKYEYVTKYKTVPHIVKRTRVEYVNKVKSIPVYFYTNKCDIKFRNECKEVEVPKYTRRPVPTTSAPKYTRRPTTSSSKKYVRKSKSKPKQKYSRR